MGFDSRPDRVLERNLAIKIAIGLLLLPGVGAVLVAYLGLTRPGGSRVGGLVFVGIAVALLGIFVLLIRRERSTRIKLHPEGIELSSGGGSRSIRWDAVEGLYIHAANIADGGSMLVRAAIQGGPGGQRGLDHRSSHVEVTVIGGGQKIQFSKSFVGCVDAFRDACARVYPRLLAEAEQRVKQGTWAGFGARLALSATVVSINGHEVPFAELEQLSIERGVVVARRRGKVLAVAKVPVREVANLDVFFDLHARLTRAVPRSAESSLVRERFTR